MAFEISEAQIEKIVEQVLRSLPDASAPAAQWDATGYGGRKFIGIFESMEAAIEATAAGYFSEDQAALITGEDQGYVLKFKSMGLRHHTKIDSRRIRQLITDVILKIVLPMVNVRIES